MLASENPMTAATATKAAVHVPWFEMAFKLIEMPSMPDPATKIQSLHKYQLQIFRYREAEGSSLTEGKSNTKDLSANAAKHQATSLINAVNLAMSDFEDSDHIARPSGNSRNNAEQNDTWDHP